MTSQTLRFIFDHFPRQQQKGRGRLKFEHLEIEKRFLDEIKIIFHIYLGAIIW